VPRVGEEGHRIREKTENHFGSDECKIQRDADREGIPEIRRRVMVAMRVCRHGACLIAFADNATRKDVVESKEAVREGDPDRLYGSASGERSALWS
jgi:hypothetical protein